MQALGQVQGVESAAERLLRPHAPAAALPRQGLQGLGELGRGPRWSLPRVLSLSRPCLPPALCWRVSGHGWEACQAHTCLGCMSLPDCLGPCVGQRCMEPLSAFCRGKAVALKPPASHQRKPNPATVLLCRDFSSSELFSPGVEMPPVGRSASGYKPSGWETGEL